MAEVKKKRAEAKEGFIQVNDLGEEVFLEGRGSSARPNG
jgi:hypothetical protein